ncbi:hypothetical protein B296_00034335 [Ensete ventricosum]|uniref:Uncharacterized protein n=1 Tax=Ensete ventricosum TaxID=4639 RepID=A0A426X1Q1_ENSVE|nr:hypothetical protein B296_00034335 [Ensete ventricosum]
MCASPPAIVSTQSCSLSWGKGFSSGRPLIPARRSDRVGSRRDPSDGQVSLVVDFTIPLLRRAYKGFYSNSNGVSVPEALIFFIAYHTAAPHHAVRGLYGEACACS